MTKLFHIAYWLYCPSCPSCWLVQLPRFRLLLGKSKVDPWVLQTAAEGETEFLVYLTTQADLSAARHCPPSWRRAAMCTRHSPPLPSAPKRLSLLNWKDWAWITARIGSPT